MDKFLSDVDMNRPYAHAWDIKHHMSFIYVLRTKIFFNGDKWPIFYYNWRFRSCGLELLVWRGCRPVGARHSLSFNFLKSIYISSLAFYRYWFIVSLLSRLLLWDCDQFDPIYFQFDLIRKPWRKGLNKLLRWSIIFPLGVAKTIHVPVLVDMVSSFMWNSYTSCFFSTWSTNIM